MGNKTYTRSYPRCQHNKGQKRNKFMVTERTSVLYSSYKNVKLR